MLTAMQTAQTAMNYACNKGYPISNLTLARMLYVLQATHIKATGRLLFEDEFQATPLGPIVKKVYSHFAPCGGRAITRDALTPPAYKIEFAEMRFITDGVDAMHDWAPFNYVCITQAPDSPWYAACGGDPYSATGSTIPNDVLLMTYEHIDELMSMGYASVSDKKLVSDDLEHEIEFAEVDGKTVIHLTENDHTVTITAGMLRYLAHMEREMRKEERSA